MDSSSGHAQNKNKNKIEKNERKKRELCDCVGLEFSPCAT
jgi:hypothetical protein